MPIFSDAFKKLGAPVKDDTSLRLDQYLAKHFKFLDRKGWKNRILQQEVLVDKVAIKPSSPMRLGQQIYFYHPPDHEPDVPRNLLKVYRDETLLAISKPPYLPMHEGGAYRKHTFAQFLGAEFGQEWAAVHRLDRETSGLVLCARDEATRRELSKLFMEQRIQKKYLAIVRGKTRETFYNAEAIGDLKTSQIRIKRWVSSEPDAQPAHTEFETLAQNAEQSLVLCTPLSGRTNQIRIHLAALGFPIVGDKLYHPKEEVFLDFLEHQDHERASLETGHPRCLLHAWKKKFELQNRSYHLRADIPADFRQKIKEYFGVLPEVLETHQ